MKQEMLINVAQAEECRIAIVEDGVLEELYLERTSQDNYVGNIYKGEIVNLEPSIQAAFVDFGVGRNGFLHISDVEPQYFRQGGYDPDKPILPNGGSRDDRDFDDDRRRRRRRRATTTTSDEVRRQWPRPRRPPQRRRRRTRARMRAGVRPRFKPPIQEIFHRGDEVLVQVIKEGIGTKGPTLSTYISIPGRYLVLMPALGRIGVSRKIEERRRSPPAARHSPRAESAEGRRLHRAHRRHRPHEEGTVARPGVPAAAVEGDRSPDQEDHRPGGHLRRKRHDHPHDPRHLHRRRRHDLHRRAEGVRAGQRILADRDAAVRQPAASCTKAANRCSKSTSSTRRSRRSTSARCRCKGGGSLVIDQTEALVAIDVNSGNFRTDGGAEESAYQLNQIAAKEIARQLRLRDLGGVVVNDFIDMRKERNRRSVERTLRDAVRRDRARTKILRTSPFGLIEMTRQRIRPSIKRSVYKECPACSGSGLVKSAESMAIEVVRKLQHVTSNKQVSRVIVTVEEEVASYLNNKKRRDLVQLEQDNNVEVQVVSKEGLSPEFLKIDCQDANGREVRIAEA